MSSQLQENKIDISVVTNYIKKNDIGRCLDYIIDLDIPNNRDFLILRRMYTEITDKNRSGRIRREEYNLQMNVIIDSILEFIQN